MERIIKQVMPGVAYEIKTADDGRIQSKGIYTVLELQNMKSNNLVRNSELDELITEAQKAS